VWRRLNRKNQIIHEREPNVIQSIGVDLLATKSEREGGLRHTRLLFAKPSSDFICLDLSLLCFFPLKTRFNLKRDGSALAWLRLNHSVLPLL
jgi:hypothetical protein